MKSADLNAAIAGSDIGERGTAAAAAFGAFFDGHALLPSGAPVAVAVSGGPDSMALAWLCARRHAEGLFPPIHAITVDHGLRPEAADEARRVGEWLAGWPGVSHAVLTRPGPARPTRLMEDARRDRYRLMGDYCRARGINVLLTAHHRDDQAETVLMRLAAGSGLDGLGGMRGAAARGGLAILRPLLAVSKADLAGLCEACAVPFIRDPSNENDLYLRPRLRRSAEILAVEGLTAERLARTASRLARAADALDHYARAAAQEALVEAGPDRVVFRRDSLAARPEEIRMRVVRDACRAIRETDVGEEYGPRMARLEDLTIRLFASDRMRETLAGCMFTSDMRKNVLVIEKEK